MATAAGLGAVAVLRLSGPRARELGTSLTGRLPPPRRASLRDLRGASGGHLDRALVLFFPGPDSFTGEDLVELHTHGGQVVPGRVLAALVDQGARLAAPGEFSRRALLAGKLTLEQAEAMNDLVHAQDEAFAQVALEQLRGALRGKVEGFRARLIDVAALLEAGLDHPEEDLPELDPEAVLEELAGLGAELDQLTGSFARGRLLRQGQAVALVGAPNVGKSSLMNALLREERALVTPEAGTTRDVLEEGLGYGGVRYRLQDTAGLRATPSLAEAAGVARARRVAEEAGVRVIVTVSGEPLGACLDELGGLDPGRDVLVRNKADLVPPERDRELPAGALLDGVPVHWTSAPGGQGLEALMATVHHRASRLHPRVGPGEVVVTTLRHQEALRAATGCLRSMIRLLRAGDPLDVALVELYAASGHLGAILGVVGVEDVLDRIFERFCLGK